MHPTVALQTRGNRVDDTNPLPVDTQARQYTTAPSSSAILTAAGSVLTLGAGEKGVIVNLGTNPLYVCRAAGASPTNFHEVLAAGVVPDDGTGGRLEIDDHVGVLSVAGTAVRFLAWKVS